MDDSYPTASRQMIRKPRNKSTIYTEMTLSLLNEL